MATSTIKRPYTENNLLDWGNYNTIGQFLNLKDSIFNYDFLMFRCGFSTDSQTGGGVYMNILPKSQYGSVNDQKVGLFWCLNGNFVSMNLSLTANNQYKIIGRNGYPTFDGGLRSIIGYKLQ